MEMNPSDPHRGMLLTQPIVSDNEIDMEFLSKLLADVSYWLKRKQKHTNSDNSLPNDFGSDNQPFNANFGARDVSDPMSNFIAGIGKAQI
jgi:hypothetical protein